jgi:hypothetical protein
MGDAKPNGGPEVPLEAQAEIRRQIRDIVERYGGRRPPRIFRRPGAPSVLPSDPAPAEAEKGVRPS